MFLPAKNKFEAIIKGRCPACRKGNMFEKPYGPFRRQNMYSTCKICGLRFEVEVGFFWGAMFISYFLNVAEGLLITLLVFELSHSYSPWLYSVILILGSFFFITFNYRFGRILLLHWFGGIRYINEH